ncbi:MAG: hypothetical protein Q4D99_01550 [Bacillota bacterium]|nr:hypothetical protein [Bacillota bacterium]
MLRKIDSTLRKIALVLGALLVISELTKDNTETKETRKKRRIKHGYQSEEFDDIW